MKINNIGKRILLFLFGCMTIRIIFVILAKKINNKYLPYLGYLSLLPMIGFIYIYLTNSRKTGREVFGDKIYWNDLRPIHAILYGAFAYNSIKKNKNAWVYLLIDVIIGLIVFVNYHYTNNNFSKILIK